MDFEELFENKHRYKHKSGQDKDHHFYSDHHKYSESHGHPHDKAFMDPSGYIGDNMGEYQGYYSHPHSDHNKWLRILQNIRGNKKLRTLVLIGGLVILVIIILLIMAFLPIIKNLINYLMENGLKGMMDGITGFIEKIWSGSGK
jgi:hypothetical protein